MLLDQNGPRLAVLSWCTIGSCVDGFGSVFQFDATVHISRQFVDMRDLGENIDEIRFHLVTELFRFFLGREDFDTLSNSGYDVNRFDFLEFVFHVVAPVMTYHVQFCDHQFSVLLQVLKEVFKFLLRRRGT